MSILANNLSEKGFDVELAFLRIRNAYEISEKVNLIALCEPNEKVGFLKAYKKLKSLYKNTNADVIISFLLPINFITILATRGLRKKIIISERNDPKIASSRWQFYLSKIIYPLADYCVFQTKRVQSYYLNKCKLKSSMIINPIDTTSFPRKGNYSQKSFVAVGKLWPQKNHILLLDAFAAFSKEHNDYILKIYGEGPLRKSFQVREVLLSLKYYSITLIHCSTIVSVEQEYRYLMASRPILSRLSKEFAIKSIALTNCVVFPTSIKTPLAPSVINSSAPAHLVEMHGIPTHIASINAFDNPS